MNKPSCKQPALDAPTKHQLVHLFWQLSPAFTRWAESHMDQKDLTPQRVYLMLPLKERGAMTMGELRNELGVSATSITALVDVLEKEGMVKRKAHKTDRRVTLIELTTKAQKKLDDGCSDFKDNVSKIFNNLSDVEQKQLQKLLEKMRASLVKENILKE